MNLTEDEPADDVFEVVNMDGSRIVIFVRQAGFPLAKEGNDPTDSFSDDDPTEPSYDGDQEDNHDLDLSVNDPHNVHLDEHGENSLDDAPATDFD